MPKAKTDFKALIGAARKQDADPESQEKPKQNLEIPAKSSPTEAEGGPRYLKLAVKTVRLRPDQRESLTLIASRLSRAKRGGERITDDTLIRVAVDALLTVADQLEGHSEAELQQRFYELLKF